VSCLELVGIAGFSLSGRLTKLNRGERRSGQRERLFLRAGVLAFALCFLGLLTSCGSSFSIKAPSGLSYPQTSIVATVGTPIATDTPTVTGTVASYAVNPALPAGLNFSTSTGTISGTPTAASAQTSYQVTATNSKGSTSATVQITVNAAIPAPSNLTYPQSSIAALVGTAIATDTPSVTGTVSSWSVSPSLPGGLSLSSTTGAISGIPTAASAQATYTVTAANAGGSTKATLQITVTAVIAAPANLSYPAPTIAALLEQTITTDTPTVVGTVTNWSVSPPLPTGLSLNLTTGAISGTPTAAAASSSYTVTAANSGGSATAVLRIGVVAATVNQVVHATAISDHQTYHAGLGYIVPAWNAVLPSNSPIKSALSRALGNRRHPVQAAARATPEGVSGLEYDDDFGLYVSGFVISGNTMAINFYVDAAGTIPAGAVTATLPAGVTVGSYSALNYPLTIQVTGNITAGNIPATGSGTMVMLDSTPSGSFQFTGTLLKIGLTVSVNLALDDNLNATGTITETQNGEQITFSNLQGAITGTLSGSVVVMPQNYTGTANVSILNGTSSMILNTPSGVATAATGLTGVLQIQYPDGSTETLTDPNDTQPDAPPSLSTSGPSNLSYALPLISATQLFLIANDTPTLTGTATAWNINPSLPAGLSIDPASGIISGTPAVVSPTTNYVVTASNADGFTQGTVQIAVAFTPAPTQLFYPQTTIAAVVGTPIDTGTPTVLSNGSPLVIVTSWSVTPALPAGLSLDPTSGDISGTPTAASPQTTYTVTAGNVSGSITTTVQISVSAGGNGVLGITYPVPSIVTNEDQAITPDIPTLVGSFTSFVAVPDLPYGLSIDQITGTISGTPITQTPPSVYTITACTAYQCVGQAIQITVNETPIQGIVAQDAVFTGSTLNLASFPSATAQSFQWTLTNQTGGGTITAGFASDLIQYSTNSTPGTYQLSVTTQAASGNPKTVSRTLNVVNQQFLKDPTTSWDRGTPTASLLANGTILFVGTGDLTMGVTAPDSTEIFDPVSGTFSAAAGMTLPRSTGQAQVSFSNGKVLVCGGLSVTVNEYGLYENGGSTADTEIYDPAADIWATVATMNSARTGHTDTLLQNGKVLAAGGKDANGNLLNSAEIYDPIANAWAVVASLNTARFGHTATLLNNGTVLITGGQDSGGNALHSAEIYDPVANTWTAAGSLQTSGTGYTATLLNSGKVLVTGGSTYDTDGNYYGLSSAQIYDPVAGTWSNAASMSTTLLNHTATLLSNGTVLVAGGHAGDGYVPTASAAVYDPVANTWTNVASLNVPRFNHVALPLPNGNVVVAYGSSSYYSDSGVSQGSAETYNLAANTWTATGMTVQLPGFSATQLANGQVLIAGGSSPTGYGVANLAQIFKPATNTWSFAASLNTARQNHTATLLQNGKVLVVGGDIAVGATEYSQFPAVLASAELYDPAANTWTAVASLTTGRTLHTATLLANGKVLVAGGVDSNDNLVATAEVYDQNANSWTPAGSLINPRYQHTATLLNTGKVLLAGGNGENYGSGYLVPLSAAELYDPSANSWTAAATMPIGVLQHTATLLSNGTVVIAGGYEGYVQGGASAAVMLYTPSTNTWSQLAAMNNPRQQHAATLLGSGQILVTGGYGVTTGNGTVIPSEIYTPSTNTWTIGAPPNLPRYAHSSVLLGDERVMIVGGYLGYIPEFWKQ
jgi:N-acetylneuraminic acid mutarotase